MPSDHALLAPSAAKRWMTCHPSALLESKEPRKDTPFTLEGTVAHALAERLLCFYRDRRMLPAPDILKEVEGWGSQLDDLRQQASDLGADFDDMLVTVHDGYVSVVIMDYYEHERAYPDETFLMVEQRLDLSAYVPDGFGSSDAVLVSHNLMIVYDLKYGKGVKVFAQNNPQAMCYGLGALIGPGEPYPVEEVELAIIQPRLHNDSRWRLSAQDLRWWGSAQLRPAAEKAFRGEGDLVPGDHCRFCAVAPKCKALAQKARTLRVQGSDPGLMDPKELGELLGELDAIKTWVAQVESYALERALQGNAIPGFKVVAGRSLRTIKDTAAAMLVLQRAGFDEATYCKPKELKTITDLEKLLKKKGFQELLGDFVVKPQGKPTLVPESDPRPELSSADMDFKDL